MLYVRYDDRSPCPDAADPDVRTTDLSLGRMENQKASPNDQNGICDYVYHVRTILSMVCFRSSIAKRHSSLQQKALGSPAATSLVDHHSSR